MSYKCPECGRNTKLLHVREVVLPSSYGVWRRRECSQGHRFTTYERQKEDGSIAEPSFDPMKEPKC